jgi:putative transposase
MCALFRNKYRIESTRYRGYDYSSPGKYFITICTKNKIPYFGNVENGKMILSELGIIAENFWREIPDHFPNIKLDEFIIMPDHIHGIIIIEAPKLGVSTKSEFQSNPSVEAPNSGASTDSIKIISPGKLSEAPNLGASIENIENIENIKSRNPFWKSNSIGSIINQFKRICTITIKTRGFDFSWQPRYYDHIIRTRIELYRIRKYIRDNPEKWIGK